MSVLIKIYKIIQKSKMLLVYIYKAFPVPGFAVAYCSVVLVVPTLVRLNLSCIKVGKTILISDQVGRPFVASCPDVKMSFIFVDTGQCGNQLGCCILDSLYQHLQHDPFHVEAFFRTSHTLNQKLGYMHVLFQLIQSQK